jgi:hypothetical protein
LWALPVAIGAALGFFWPRWRVIDVEFAAGGHLVVVQGDSVALPGTMQVDDDGRLRLRVVNRDSVEHQAGAYGVSPADSATVIAQLCTGQPHGVARTIALR